jgi:hypothetical protein
MVLLMALCYLEATRQTALESVKKEKAGEGVSDEKDSREVRCRTISQNRRLMLPGRRCLLTQPPALKYVLRRPSISTMSQFAEYLNREGFPKW